MNILINLFFGYFRINFSFNQLTKIFKSFDQIIQILMLYYEG